MSILYKNENKGNRFLELLLSLLLLTRRICDLKFFFFVSNDFYCSCITRAPEIHRLPSINIFYGSSNFIHLIHFRLL